MDMSRVLHDVHLSQNKRRDDALVVSTGGETIALRRLPHREQLVASTVGALFEMLDLSLLPLGLAREHLFGLVLCVKRHVSTERVSMRKSVWALGQRAVKRTSLILVFLSSSLRCALSCGNVGGQECVDSENSKRRERTCSRLDLLLQLRIDVLGTLNFELVLELFDLALLVFELLLQFRVLGSRFVPSLLRLFELPPQFDFDGGRARLGGLVGFVGSAGRDVVVCSASLGQLFTWDKRGRRLALSARILEAPRPVKQGAHLGREFCDLFLQLFDHATSADFVESVSLLQKGAKNVTRVARKRCQFSTQR